MHSEKQIKNKTYIKNDDIKKIANKVIENNGSHLSLGNSKIEYISVYPYISKTTVARCIKTSNELKYFSDADYIIEVSGDLWDNINDRLKDIVIFHELKHIFVTANKKGETLYKMLDHDVKDFAVIINKFGIDWFNELRTLTSSVYNLKPEEEDGLSL